MIHFHSHHLTDNWQWQDWKICITTFLYKNRFIKIQNETVSKRKTFNLSKYAAQKAEFFLKAPVFLKKYLCYIF